MTRLLRPASDLSDDVQRRNFEPQYKIRFLSIHLPHLSGEASDRYSIYPTLRHVSRSLNLGRRGSSWHHQAPLPYNNFIVSTRLHPAFKTSFAVHFTEAGMWNAYGTSRVMTPPGLPTIWTGCVDESPSVTRYLSRRRFSTISDLPASLRGNVYANSGACAARCGSSRHPTRSHLTS